VEAVRLSEFHVNEVQADPSRYTEAPTDLVDELWLGLSKFKPTGVKAIFCNSNHSVLFVIA